MSVLLGGHPIKLGLSRYLIDLMERGWITHLATNGAGIIYDFELALVGGTSENVRRGRFVPWNNGSRSSDIDSAGWLMPIRLTKTLTQHATAATALGGSAGPLWKRASPTPT
ncbi:MAG TPA: hypothetical protein GX399_03490 [Xanthomonadaceae bacterium]|nr:hypothetical protein [Xanthomonadaceae bacterium]